MINLSWLFYNKIRFLPKFWPNIQIISVFSFELEIELLKNIGINKHKMKLVEGKQLSYKHIYILCLIRLETLNTYIEIYLKTGFIQSFKSFIDALIQFIRSLILAFTCMSIIKTLIIFQLKLIFSTSDWQIFRSTKSSQVIHLARSYQRLLLDENLWKW